MNKPPSIRELRETVRISIIEGMFAQAFGSLSAAGSIFLTKFALLMNAGPVHLGLLAAIGQISLVFQPVGIIITRRLTSRKRPILRLLLYGRTIPLLFGLLPFVLPQGAAIWFFLGLLMISSAIQSVAGNLWIAWISDSIPIRIRGRFFSWRSLYLLPAGLLTGFLFSAFLDLFDPQTSHWLAPLRQTLHEWQTCLPEHLPWAFIIVFAAGTAAGIASMIILARQPERPKRIEYDSVAALLVTPLRDRNFRRLLVYGLWWMLAVGVAAPFWGPFMINNLRMSLVQIQIYGLLSTAASLLSLRAWGALIDRSGNKAAMRIAIVLGGINPSLWMFAGPDRTWVVYCEAVTSGIMWAGAGIVATNFVLAIAPEDKAQIYSGVYGAFTGAAMMLTMLLSGVLLPPPASLFGLHLEPEQVLFGLGGLCRLSAQIPLTWIHEPRARGLESPVHYLRQVLHALRAVGKHWISRFP